MRCYLCNLSNGVAAARQRGRMHTHYSCARYARHSSHKLCANSPANGKRTRRPLERSAGDLICCHRSEIRDQLAQITTLTHTHAHIHTADWTALIIRRVGRNESAPACC